MSYSGLEEKEILCLLKSGDTQALGELYSRNKVQIFANIRRLVKSEDIAEELLQDVFVKVWDKRDLLDPEKSFRSYLFRIAENLVYDFFRKAARDKKLEAHIMSVATELYSHIEETLYTKESTSILNRAVEQLPPQRRRVFTLCKIEGRSYEEVSQLLGISTSTINDHIVKATRSVREYLFLSKDAALLLLIAAIIGRN